MLDFCENQNQDLRTVEWCWTALIPLDNFAKHVTGSPETGTTRPPLPAPAKAELCQENLGVFSTPLASKVYLYLMHCCFTWDICGARLHSQKRLLFFKWYFFSPAGESDTEPRGKASAQDLARGGARWGQGQGHGTAGPLSTPPCPSAAVHRNLCQATAGKKRLHSAAALNIHSAPPRCQSPAIHAPVFLRSFAISGTTVSAFTLFPRAACQGIIDPRGSGWPHIACLVTKLRRPCTGLEVAQQGPGERQASPQGRGHGEQRQPQEEQGHV